jgi:glycosyltransferase involved in cell wall biosynthesis
MWSSLPPYHPDMEVEAPPALGVVVERDPGALAAAIRPLLDDAGRRATLGAAARDRFAAEFAYERMVARWDALLADALTSSRRAGRPGAASSSG